jgi:hypothetical protein
MSFINKIEKCYIQRFGKSKYEADTKEIFSVEKGLKDLYNISSEIKKRASAIPLIAAA